MIAFAPIVSLDEKESWEEYVLASLVNTTVMPQPIHSVEAHDGDHDGQDDDHKQEGKEYYLPLWQLDPTPNDHDASGTLINMDLASYAPIKDLVEKVLATKEPASSQILDLKFLYKFIEVEDVDQEAEDQDDDFGASDEDPHALLVYPVFENFDDRRQELYDGHHHHDEDLYEQWAHGQSAPNEMDDDPESKPMIKGFVFTIFPLQIIFKNDELIRGMYTVLSDTCGQQSQANQFTYYIAEKKATLLGQGDFHERKFNYLNTHIEFEPEEGEEDESEEAESDEHGEHVRFLAEHDCEVRYNGTHQTLQNNAK